MITEHTKAMTDTLPSPSRFTRSQQATRDDDALESPDPADVSRHSSRYARSALPSKESQYKAPFMQDLSMVLFILQVGLVFLFVFGTKYSSHAYSPDEYVIYRDIMAMLLIGFGYLMTFLRKYGLGAVGFTLLLTALGMQLNIFVELFIRFLYYGSDEDQHSNFPLAINMMTMIDAEFFAATLLITYGAVIGRASPILLLVIMISESFFYSLNKVMVVFGAIEVEDVGGTLTIHLFGAYFGVALSYALGPQDIITATNADARRFSDLLSLIGTTILWIFWPSFVGATETGAPENEARCVINTVLALLGSTVATFCASLHLGKYKFDAVHIANSSLAGGVAVGASARLEMGGPGGALLLGVLAGFLSVFGYFKVSNVLETKIGLSDTCGVHNLHGLPAILGGFASAVFVTLDTDADFLLHDKPTQAFKQVAATIATTCLAGVSGYFTGFVINKLTLKREGEFPEYDDSVFWWEGEFYENVNTVDSMVDDAQEGTHRGEPSISTKACCSVVPLAEDKV